MNRPVGLCEGPRERPFGPLCIAKAHRTSHSPTPSSPSQISLLLHLRLLPIFSSSLASSLRPASLLLVSSPPLVIHDFSRQSRGNTDPFSFVRIFPLTSMCTGSVGLLLQVLPKEIGLQRKRKVTAWVKGQTIRNHCVCTSVSACM